MSWVCLNCGKVNKSRLKKLPKKEYDRIIDWRGEMKRRVDKKYKEFKEKQKNLPKKRRRFWESVETCVERDDLENDNFGMWLVEKGHMSILDMVNKLKYEPIPTHLFKCDVCGYKKYIIR